MSVPEMDPTVSVIVCTRNRASSLQRTIQSLLVQGASASDYEIIVVDNGSTDNTRQTVEALSNMAIRLRYIAEPQVGLSLARNTGTEAARASIVAFLDDDARAEANWVSSIIRAFHSVTPAPVALGGKVLLDWGGPEPDWLPSRLATLYSALDHGESPRYLTESEHIVGANMAFRREALISEGGFDPSLGRRGSVLRSGEEAAVIARLRKAGAGVWYEPRACVQHVVSVERRRRSWLWRRVFWDGASQPRIDYGTRGFDLCRSVYDFRRLCGLTIDMVKTVRGNRRSMRTEIALLWVQRLGRLTANLGLLAGQ